MASDDPDLNPTHVELPASACASPHAAISFLVELLAKIGKLKSSDVPVVECQILQRESLGSTAIGHGVALPHSNSAAVEEVVVIIGHSETGVRWSEVPVQQICLMITPCSNRLKACEHSKPWPSY
jgi:mannitol/fructose-specific phosphotransferase system IIA component (Ntr-type)